MSLLIERGLQFRDNSALSSPKRGNGNWVKWCKFLGHKLIGWPAADREEESAETNFDSRHEL